MCGLIIGVKSKYNEQIPRVLKTLESRGPDRTNILKSDVVVLAHTRLSILDLHTGDQPMETPDGKLKIVFNGEIYNHQDLRLKLEKTGRVFKSRSDTEVLLYAYSEWGEAFVLELDGMFAFAIWDVANKSVFCARDRLGIKPFFYSTHSGFLAASTLSPFLELYDFPKQVDFEAIRDYLAFQAILAPHSILKSVRQLEPATTIRFHANSGHHQIKRYWSPNTTPVREFNSQELAAVTDNLLSNSISAQRIADVSVGCFLSGGIDSSLIVHYMVQSTEQKVPTFSVSFPGTRHDESGAALSVAKKYQTKHTVFECSEISADVLVNSIQDLDQPLADPAYLALAQLSEASSGLVKVALTGDGADELFGGYRRYQEGPGCYPDSYLKSFMRLLLRHRALPGSLLRRSLAGLDAVLYRHTELGPWRLGRKSMYAHLNEDAINRANVESTLIKWKAALATSDTIGPSELMKADLWTYLSENCLVKSDRASMRSSLELRVPFLSNALIDLAVSTPAEQHFLSGSKTLLRNMAKEKLPEAVWNRPKHGFSLPLNDYFSQNWRTVNEHYIQRCASAAPFLNKLSIEKTLRQAQVGRGSVRLAYTFLVLLIWLSKHTLDFTEEYAA